GGLARDALHHVAVAAQDVDVVVKEVEAGPIEVAVQPTLRDGHADRRGDTLTQRASGGLDSGRVTVFGVARAAAVQLAELLDLVERHRQLAGGPAVGSELLYARQVER